MLPLVGAHNLTGARFSLETMMVLNRGLKFITTPPALQQDTLQRSFDRFDRLVRLRFHCGDGGQVPKFRVPNPAFQPKPAPGPVEDLLADLRAAALSRHAALHQQQSRVTHNMWPWERTALQQLRQQSGVIIKPADKNLGLVIMAESDYRACVQQHVSDTRVYEDVTDCLGQQIEKACKGLERLLADYNVLFSEAEHEYMRQGLQQNMQQPAHLYVLPKLHKMKQMCAPIIGRPIAACHSWITTCISQVVCDKLNAALHKFDTILLDKAALIPVLESAVVSQDTFLLTFDVESLYPSIDQAQCAEACAMAVSGDSRTKHMVHDAVMYVLKHNIVQVEGRYYRQISGGAMGNNLLPPAAQLYLAIKWEGVVRQRMGDKFPKLFKRFLDDGFVVFEGSEEELLAFVGMLQSALGNINITFHYSRFQVDYLDLVVYKADLHRAACSLKVRTHQKALNKYLYIPRDSFHPRGVFGSFLRAELIRYVVTNSDPIWYDCMVQKFTHRLRRRGYPLHGLEAAIAAVSYSDRHKYLHRTEGNPAQKAGAALVVPYATGVPQLQLQQLLHCVYATHPEAHHHMSKPLVCFTKGRSLGAMLVKAGA
jgi:hypothetical protein